MLLLLLQQLNLILYKRQLSSCTVSFSLGFISYKIITGELEKVRIFTIHILFIIINPNKAVVFISKPKTYKKNINLVVPSDC